MEKTSTKSMNVLDYKVYIDKKIIRNAYMLEVETREIINDNFDNKYISIKSIYEYTYTIYYKHYGKNKIIAVKPNQILRIVYKKVD